MILIKFSFKPLYFTTSSLVLMSMPFHLFSVTLNNLLSLSCRCFCCFLIHQNLIITHIALEIHFFYLFQSLMLLQLLCFYLSLDWFLILLSLFIYLKQFNIWVLAKHIKDFVLYTSSKVWTFFSQISSSQYNCTRKQENTEISNKEFTIN